jgi:predicted restriction endonuclease
LQSRVDNVQLWTARLLKIVPVSSIAMAVALFDTQKLQNPEISGFEYQQGELFGYEVKEYLLEKWERKCAYCGAGNIRLEVSHIVPLSKNGSNRVSNLIISCRNCIIKSVLAVRMREFNFAFM